MVCKGILRLTIYRFTIYEWLAILNTNLRSGNCISRTGESKKWGRKCTWPDRSLPLRFRFVIFEVEHEMSSFCFTYWFITCQCAGMRHVGYANGFGYRPGCFCAWPVQRGECE